MEGSSAKQTRLPDWMTRCTSEGCSRRNDCLRWIDRDNGWLPSHSPDPAACQDFLPVETPGPESAAAPDAVSAGPSHEWRRWYIQKRDENGEWETKWGAFDKKPEAFECLPRAIKLFGSGRVIRRVIVDGLITETVEEADHEATA